MKTYRGDGPRDDAFKNDALPMRGSLQNIGSIFVTGSIEMKPYLVPEIADLLHYFEI